MTNKSTPIKKDLLSNDKTSNNQSTTTNILNPEPEYNPPPQNLLNSTENCQNKSTQNFTFKIIKRRAPWNKKEDDAIIELVNKYGTSNWTIIANEMALLNKSKHRNGKQCRERWHNHLDPIVNKENWTEEEENILFNKHLEYGNKWSDISKYLPGRTDNSIKNHFYSKLRKFIRKILKQINKENLLKNHGIDYYKYNSDKVYKLLKKYKITYKNVTKETILDLIIATEKNQKGKIFGLNDDNKIVSGNNITITNKSNIISNLPFNLENNILNNNNEKQNVNISGNKITTKPIFNKKTRIKSKMKNHDNDSLLKRDKKIFQSNIVNTEIKPINDNILQKRNKNDDKTNNNEIQSKITRKYKKKKLLIIGDKNFTNNENDINENNISNDNYIKTNKKNLSINPDDIQETYKIKNKVKSKIKDKEKINNNDNKKLLTKKRRRKKKRKVSISLSTPENKKTQINRIMPGRKFIFGLGQKLPISNKTHKKNNISKNKFEINPEDFDPMINEVEIVREGLEIHSKSIILINKNLLTDKLFPEMNYQFKPNISIALPLSPKIQQFPGGFQKTVKNGDDNNYISTFNDKNISIGFPTPMGGAYEPQISPVGLNNILFFPQPSTRNIINVDFGNDNDFLRKHQMLTPKTKDLQNKILIQNNNNIIGEENDDNNFHEKIKKLPELNLDIINNNENNNFGDNIAPSVAKQMINTPANIFNLSPTSPFILRTFVDKTL